MDIIDADYQPVEKHIRGKVLYYTTSQVADILEIRDSKVRYYTNEFADLFDEGDIIISNTQRKYTQQAIDKLKYFNELKNEGLSLKQIKEYCQEIKWDKEGIQVPDSTPLPIQVISTAIREETNKDILALKEELLQSIRDIAKVNQEEMLKQVAITVDEVIADKLEEFKTDFIKQQQEEKDATIKTMEMVEKLQEKMNERKEENHKKGFLNRLFNKY